MKYPNARKGVTKILFAEILEIILSVLALIELVLVTSHMTPEPVVAELIIMISIGVLETVALIVYLIGLSQSKKDEPEFGKAIMFTLIGLILSVIVFALEEINPVLSGWFEFGYEIVSLLAFEAVVTAVVTLGRSMGHDRIVSIGKKMRVLVTIIWTVVIVTRFLKCFTPEGAEAVSYISEILETIDHIFYIVLLSLCIKMLASDEAGFPKQEEGA